MSDELKPSRLQRFINDEVTSGFVYEVIRDSFLKTKGQRDVQTLAAERLAVEFLEVAWRELEKFKETKDENSTPSKQVGL